MGIMSLIVKLFGADVAAPPDAMKLDGTTKATLTRSLSALPPDERGWITFAEARVLFSTKDAQYAFGEADQDGRRDLESFAAQHRSVINFMPVEERVYFHARSDGCDEHCLRGQPSHPGSPSLGLTTATACIALDLPGASESGRGRCARRGRGDFWAAARLISPAMHGSWN